jgi:hypothetical protein
MTAEIIVKTSNASVLAERNILSFSFKKDMYTPYTAFSARALASNYSFDNSAEVLFSIDGNTIHHGLIDDIRWKYSHGKKFVNIRSRGFTSLLTQNQIEPGLKMNISFNDLMDNFYTLPYVTHENNSDNSSYIYVRPNTSMWDAAANLAYKLLGTYPYVRGTNTVMITPFSSPTSFDLSNVPLISVGSEISGIHLVSNYHMADINGNYGTYELGDSDVINMKIIRHKFFDLDMRFLYAPQHSLVFRDKFDNRGCKKTFCSYSGYHGEDIYDLVTFGDVSASPIGSVSITGSSNGIFTEIGVYTDKFPHT